MPPTPPIAKKNNAEAPYMMPIFLWSTVLTQARHPVFARGRVKTPRGAWGVTAPPEGSASTSEVRSSCRHGFLYFSVWR